MEANKTTQIVKMEGKKLVELAIRRDDSGFQIYIQSPMSWKLFCSPDDRVFTLAGVSCSRPRDERLANINGAFTTNPNFEYDGYPNLSILLAKNINSGVTFNFGIFPISNKKVQEWIHNFHEQVKTLYLSYCKPVNTRVIFTTATIEPEIHD